MGQMVVPVAVELCQNGPSTEPFPDEFIDCPRLEQRVVRGLVHEDREPQLPGADHDDGKGERQRVGPHMEHRDHCGNHAPAMQDQQRAHCIGPSGKGANRFGREV